MKLVYFSIFVLLVSACKNESAVEESNINIAELSEEQVVDRAQEVKNLVLPSGCDLLSLDDVASTFGIDEASIMTKDGNPNNKDSRPCFFKWSDPSIRGAGILVQIMKNPVPHEFLDWPANYISSKINSGEGSSEGTKTLYEPLTGLGVDGAYNHDHGKYYWRSAEDLVFMIAYNLEIEGPERLKHVKVLGKKMMDNYRELAK